MGRLESFITQGDNHSFFVPRFPNHFCRIWWVYGGPICKGSLQFLIDHYYWTWSTKRYFREFPGSRYSSVFPHYVSEIPFTLGNPFFCSLVSSLRVLAWWESSLSFQFVKTMSVFPSKYGSLRTKSQKGKIKFPSVNYLVDNESSHSFHNIVLT